MTITPATRLGVYEITAPLGEGGMGQVWRARDTKLDRDVAIKVLPEAFANDADRLARFTREAKWQVSTAEGAAPRWRADGKELYFLAPDATMMAVPVTASGASFEAGTPKALFPTHIVDGGTIATNRPQYAVARDGGFLINQPVADAIAAPITLILNWNPEAKK